MTGTKVEAIHHHGVEAVERFVVGRVLEVGPHPDADRLRVCEVDLGAANDDRARADRMRRSERHRGTDGGRRASRRGHAGRHQAEEGEASRGGLGRDDSRRQPELEIGTGDDGILVLDDFTPDAEFAPGTPLAEVLPIATEVLELEITPNRPDCLGVYGVARELHAATRAPLFAPPWQDDPGSEPVHSTAPR